jgi:hypothetical protein
MENVVQIEQYRPICLLNVSFKIFTKTGTNRMTGIVEKVVQPTQTAFMRGTHVLEDVVILHETIHKFHRKKLDGVLLKINFQKPYAKLIGYFCNKQCELRGSIPNGVNRLRGI